MGTRMGQKVTLSRQLLGFLANAVKWKKSRKKSKNVAKAKKGAFYWWGSQSLSERSKNIYSKCSARFSVCAMMQKAPSLCTDSADLIKKFNAHWSKIQNFVQKYFLIKILSRNIWIFTHRKKKSRKELGKNIKKTLQQKNNNNKKIDFCNISGQIFLGKTIYFGSVCKVRMTDGSQIVHTETRRT